MNQWIGFFPALLGALVVLQAGLNRKIAAHWGMPVATMLNALVFVLGALVILGISWARPSWVPSNFENHFDWSVARIWFLIPGLIGLTLVVGGPWAIGRWGAAQTFVLLVSGQLVTSLLWDWKVEGLPVSKERLFGIALAWAGVWLSTRGR